MATLTLKAIILGPAMVTVNGASQAAPGNLCPNPGFELLNPAGDNFPLQWRPSRSETGKSQATIAELAFPITASLLNWFVLGVHASPLQFAGFGVVWWSILSMTR